MKNRPSLKDKILTPEKIEEAYKQLTAPVAAPAPPPPVAPAPASPMEPAAVKRSPLPDKPSRRRDPEPAPPESFRNVRITVDLPENLHERLKLHTVIRKKTIRDFIIQLIERELREG